MDYCRIGILASGTGSNFEVIHERILDNSIPDAEIAWVISDNDEASVLDRADERNTTAYVLNSRSNLDRSNEIYEHATDYDIDLIVCAGYMKILVGKLLESYKGRILNIHPAPTTKPFRGLFGDRIYQVILESDEQLAGPTVHLVDEGLNTGEVIDAIHFTVERDETEESLKSKTQKAEHELYWQAINKYRNRFQLGNT